MCGREGTGGIEGRDGVSRWAGEMEEREVRREEVESKRGRCLC